ncbi:hypothetical protein LX36DRAFT_77350 [Colletotrichum falcatum]|nr:hypothetical protein LX36DRAFT_77350 [Colletotrichum falcatum]
MPSSQRPMCRNTPILAIQQRGKAPIVFSLPRNRRHAGPGWGADEEGHRWRRLGPLLALNINCTALQLLPFAQAQVNLDASPFSFFSDDSRSTMSSFGNFVKNGWHPEKPGTTLKGQVVCHRPRRTPLESRLTDAQNGLLGRNKDDTNREGRVARPLTSLQDPSTFAPPPKRIPGANPPPVPPSRSNVTSPGAPPPPYEDPRWRQQQEQQEEEGEAPPRPYRVDTTGLSTAHLPPPPGRKDGADGRTPPPGQAAARPPPPSLPPRLPPRTPSAASVTSPAPSAPTASGGGGGGYLNQNAISRLGAAGVSVPALGIGKPAPEPPARSNASSPAPPPRNGASGQMSQLQARFANLGKPSGQSSSSPPPAEGTTTEQKRAALRTASNLHKDPSSVSVSDARAAASTFNNFRQRHGEQVASGVKSANSLNQKYGISDKVGRYAGQVGQQQEGSAGAGTAPGPLSPPPGLVNAIGKKKPPPPPPPKKKPQAASPAPGPGDDDDDEPPPIPLATKPTF